MSYYFRPLKKELYDIFDEEIPRISKGGNWTWRNFRKMVNGYNNLYPSSGNYEELVSVLKEYFTPDDGLDARQLLIVVPLLAIKYTQWSVKYFSLIKDFRFSEFGLISTGKTYGMSQFSMSLSFFNIQSHSSYVTYDFLKKGSCGRRAELCLLNEYLLSLDTWLERLDVASRAQLWNDESPTLLQVRNKIDSKNIFCHLKTRVKVFAMLRQMSHFYDLKTRRFFTILECLGALTWEKMVLKFSQKKSYTQYLDILFNTTGEPYIKRSEIFEYLDLFVYPCSNRDIFEQEIWQEIKERFPQSEDFFNPRSLQHLSRCRLKDFLRSVNEFPSGVKNLPYPNKLKSYVLELAL